MQFDIYPALCKNTYMGIKKLSNVQIAYLKDRGTISVHRTLSDKISIPSDKESTRIKDMKGNLTFDMDICRDGVQEYLAEEIFDADLLRENEISGNSIIRVWRKPSVVFDPAAIKSHNGKPMTRNHPKGWVDDRNRLMLEKGIARGCFYNPQKHVISGTGFVTDAAMVQEIESGSFGEISDGYDSELDFEPGIVPETDGGFPCTNAGEEYDMIMRSYSPNHIAIVPEGRAGNARILDKKGAVKMTFFQKINKKKVLDHIKTMDTKEVLRMLADEEPDEERKAVLESLAEEDGAEAEDACNFDAETEEETDTEEVDSSDILDDFEISESELNDALSSGGFGPEGMVYGGVDTDFVEEFDTSGAAVDEAEARKNVLTPDGGINRTIHGMKDSNGKSVKIIREFNVLVSDSMSGAEEEVENMNARELADLVAKTVDSAIRKRFGDSKDITVGDMQIDEDIEEGMEEEDEFIGDDEAQAIGVAEEWDTDKSGSDLEAESDLEPEPNVEAEEEYISDDEAEEIGIESEEEVEDAVPETQGPTPEQFQKWAAGTTDPEAKRMFLALSEKVASMDAESEPEQEEETSGFMDMESDMLEEKRLEAASEGKEPPSGPPSNQVGDGPGERTPVEETHGYFVPKKLADSDGEKAKLLMDSVKIATSYGINGIDVDKHSEDGTIYHRIIDSSGILKKGIISGPDGVTRERLEMAIGAIQSNRQMVDGMAAITSKVRDAHVSGGFNPGTECY